MNWVKRKLSAFLNSNYNVSFGKELEANRRFILFGAITTSSWSFASQGHLLWTALTCQGNFSPFSKMVVFRNSGILSGHWRKKNEFISPHIWPQNLCYIKPDERKKIYRLRKRRKILCFYFIYFFCYKETHFEIPVGLTLSATRGQNKKKTTWKVWSYQLFSSDFDTWASGFYIVPAKCLFGCCSHVSYLLQVRLFIT